MDNNKVLDKESVFIIGYVFSVEGRTIKISVNKNKNHSHILYEGKTIKNVSVGGYVKILKGFTTIIAKVEGEYIQEERVYNKKYEKEETRVSRILQASLFGHYEGNFFRQGIKEMPLIDNECYILDRAEFNQLHQFAKVGETNLEIGHLTEEPSQEISLSVNKIFASHIGIFGNTGSGKSNTLARLYTNLFEIGFRDFESFTQNSKFVFIDFNGEYAAGKVLTEKKKVFNLNTNKALRDISESEKFRIPLEYVEDTELLSVLLEASEKTQQPFLSRALSSRYLQDPANFVSSMSFIARNVIRKEDRAYGPDVITEMVRTLAYYVADDQRDTLLQFIERVEGVLHQINLGGFYWEKTTQYDSTYNIFDTEFQPIFSALSFSDDKIDEIQIRIILHYYHQLVNGRLNPEHIGPLLGRMRKKFRMLAKVISLNSTDYEENVLILSLRGVNLEMKKTIPLLVSKFLYDRHKKEVEGENHKKSLNIIIDEAHNILSEDSERENETIKDYRLETFEEIVKEGRKFGAFLTIASQRPFDISPTIISQLHNYFIHRLINENDIAAVRRAVAYLDKLSFDSIPVLAVGSCFVAGLATDLPVKVDIDLLPPELQPKSETINLEKEWG